MLKEIFMLFCFQFQLELWQTAAGVYVCVYACRTDASVPYAAAENRRGTGLQLGGMNVGAVCTCSGGLVAVHVCTRIRRRVVCTVLCVL